MLNYGVGVAFSSLLISISNPFNISSFFNLYGLTGDLGSVPVSGVLGKNFALLVFRHRSLVFVGVAANSVLRLSEF